MCLCSCVSVNLIECVYMRLSERGRVGERGKVGERELEGDRVSGKGRCREGERERERECVKRPVLTITFERAGLNQCFETTNAQGMNWQRETTQAREGEKDKLRERERERGSSGACGLNTCEHYKNRRSKICA